MMLEFLVTNESNSAETCRAINTFSDVTFGRIKKLIISFLFILGFLFVAFCAFTILMGALSIAKLPIDNAALNYATLALFLCAAALFFGSTVTVSILLNVSLNSFNCLNEFTCVCVSSFMILNYFTTDCRKKTFSIIARQQTPN